MSAHFSTFTQCQIPVSYTHLRPHCVRWYFDTAAGSRVFRFVLKNTLIRKVQRRTLNVNNGLLKVYILSLIHISFCRIGQLLGYICQRPDKEIRQGPDVLWCTASKKYILIECKTEVLLARKSISKSEACLLYTSRCV